MKKVAVAVLAAILLVGIAVAVRGTPAIDPVSEDLVAVYGVQRKTEIGPSDTELLTIVFSERELAVWAAYFEQEGVVKSWSTLANITYSIDYSAYTVDLESTERNLVTARDIKTLSMFFNLTIGVPVSEGE